MRKRKAQSVARGPLEQPYVRSFSLVREKVPSFDAYPFSIPSIAKLDEFELHPQVTFFVGENGSGKSTLIEAIAVAAGFNAEGGSKNFNFATRRSESELHRHLRLARGVERARDGFFLRAESYFNVGTEIERLDAEPGGPPIIDAFGGVSIHEQSHGESFLRLATERFRGNGLYILDEPEAALSPSRQLSFLTLMDDLARRRRSQFVIATHSPIIMAYPFSKIMRLGPDGLTEIAYEETEQFRITKDFLNARELFLRELLRDGSNDPDGE